MNKRVLRLSLAAAGLILATGLGNEPAQEWFDPVLQSGAFCGGADGKQPALLRNLILARTEAAPFQPVPPKPALEATPVLYPDLDKLHFPISSRNRKAQAWFDQGVILAFGFNHAEAQRAFREAQKTDPSCAICYWAESLILGPNINAPMMPEAQAPALAALRKAVELGPKASEKERALIAALERVLKRNPAHAGAAHLYIHAMEASSTPEKALPHARRLAGLAPGAGHLVHMPAHIYYRLGMYRESLEVNKRAIAVDERYFKTSPSDPMYKVAYYPHNIHFVMVSAQMGGDKATALEAAAKLDASIPNEVAKQFAIVEPVKAAPYTTHAQFSDAATILALPAPDPGLLLVKGMYHYSRAVAHAQLKDAAAAKAEIAALEKMEKGSDFKALAEWQVPAKEVVQTARLVAAGRLADALGDLEGAAKAYEDAIFIEDTLAYMEPPYWYYPVRQSLGSVRLRQGRLDEAQKAFRDSLARVRNSGWSLAGLAETYKRNGNAKAERATRAAMSRAWLGPKPGPDLARL